jgi:hypothetical protein
MSWLKSLFGHPKKGHGPDLNEESLSDPVFGALTYDEKLASFEGAADWLGQPIRLSFVIEGLDPASALPLARDLWRDNEALDARMRGAILDELLPVKNEFWLQDGEADLAEADMLARLRPSGVTFYIDPDGIGFDFFFADGGLFAGHSIVVGGNSEDDALHVSLFG